MTVMRRLWFLWVLVLVAGCAPGDLTRDGARKASPSDRVGLYSSLPILWSETADLAGNLSPDNRAHWALAVLKEYGDVRGLDSLAGPRGVAALGERAILVLAQPRPLSADENVALDTWVRGGGRVMLFADPLLTSDSIYPLGDRRRPQDVVLLSPILRRWGLDLRFDDAQPAGRKAILLGGAQIESELAGSFVVGETRGCALLARGLVAQCRIGRGRVLAVADAELLDSRSDEEAKARALRWLFARLEV